MRGDAALLVLVTGAAALGAATWYAMRDSSGAVASVGGGGGALDAVEAASGAIVAEAAPWVYAVIDAGGGGMQASEAGAVSAERNVAAFLRMIRLCEVGTAGERGYRTMYGGATFDGYADHPRVRFYERKDEFIRNGKKDFTTAAGAYQFITGTWDDAARALGLADFSPASQDAAAVWLLRRRGALADVRAGNFGAALVKAGREWASLPGSPYGQPVRSLEQVTAFYEQGGGVLA